MPLTLAWQPPADRSSSEEELEFPPLLPFERENSGFQGETEPPGEDATSDQPAIGGLEHGGHFSVGHTKGSKCRCEYESDSPPEDPAFSRPFLHVDHAAENAVRAESPGVSRDVAVSLGFDSVRADRNDAMGDFGSIFR